MQFSKYLGNAAGIQYQGVDDQSEAGFNIPSSVGLYIGEFKHGRFDRLMKINQGNIRRLGYQPNNPHYQAVQDALDLGVPFIWVMRVSNRGTIIPIGCAGATDFVTIPGDLFYAYKYGQGDL